MDTPRNPYEPPAGPTGPAGIPPSTPILPAENEPVEAAALIGQAWECFKVDWAIHIGTLLLSGLFILVPFLILAVIAAAIVGTGHHGYDASSLSPQETAAVLAVYPAILVLACLVQAGMTNVWLASARGESPSLQTYFAGMRRFLPMLGLWLATFVVVFLGTAACIVPGIILGLAFYPAPYFVIDGNTGPIDALKRSWAATKGHLLQIFLLALLSFLILLAGELACLVGILVAVPIIQLSHALLYVRLTARPPAQAMAPA